MGLSAREILRNSRRGSSASKNKASAGDTTETTGQGNGDAEDGDPEARYQIDIDEALEELLPEATPDMRPRAAPFRASESARTTFRLSRDAAELFRRLSEQAGQTQKDLLTGALRLAREAWEKSPERANELAARHGTREAGGPKARKPMAIAAETREGLNQLAEETGLPRDHLVEMGIRLVKLAYEEDRRRTVDPYEDILEDLEALYQEVEEVQMALSSARTQNGSKEEYEDPVLSALREIMGRLNQMGQATREAVESGEPVEEGREFL